MPDENYTLDLDRSLPQTMRHQAREAIIAAVRSGRPGFCVGDRLTTLELSRHNAIHRNTLTAVMGDLVQLGFLRRLPNKGFEVVDPAPERPSLLTRQILSLTEAAQRDQIDTRSQLIPAETGLRQAGMLAEDPDLARVQRDLLLDARDQVSVLARCRLVKQPDETQWHMVSVEQTFIDHTIAPQFLENAIEEIQVRGDFSIYRQLRRIFPNEEFFKAHYEITILPLPANLAAIWIGSTSSLITVISITYCSQGPVELTRTWFDASQAVLMAGSLDVRLVDAAEEVRPNR
jgi:DNA-binding GntR family transcriptional regulator